MIDCNVPPLVAPCREAGFIQLLRDIERQRAFDLKTVQRVNVAVQRAFDVKALRQDQPGIQKPHGISAQAEYRHDDFLRRAIPQARGGYAALDIHRAGKAADARDMDIRIILHLRFQHPGHCKPPACIGDGT